MLGIWGLLTVVGAAGVALPLLQQSMMLWQIVLGYTLLGKKLALMQVRGHSPQSTTCPVWTEHMAVASVVSTGCSLACLLPCKHRSCINLEPGTPAATHHAIPVQLFRQLQQLPELRQRACGVCRWLVLW